MKNFVFESNDDNGRAHSPMKMMQALDLFSIHVCNAASMPCQRAQKKRAGLACSFMVAGAGGAVFCTAWRFSTSGRSRLHREAPMPLLPNF
jgi:hypothetical protein